MIVFSNGRKARYFIASGALAFDGKGWLWERPLVWLGLIKPKLFTVVLKSLTLEPRKGNLRWWKPWRCVQLIQGGAVNKVGLTNKGFDWWMKKVAPKLDFKGQNIVVSIFGTHEELVTMADRLNTLDLTAIEVNVSCPNADHASQAATIINDCKVVNEVSRHPIILKVSYDQDYLAIAAGLTGVIEAISINSVRWDIVFPGERSPLWPLEERVGGGGGGVSGYPAQKFNWSMAFKLAALKTIPVIVPSIMGKADLLRVEFFGAAVSFGAIHLPDKGKLWTLFTNPCKPTKIVIEDMRKRGEHIST